MPREVDEGAIENVYRLQIRNTDERPHRYTFEVNGPPGAGTPGSNPVWFLVRDADNADLRVMEKGVFLIPK